MCGLNLIQVSRVVKMMYVPAQTSWATKMPLLQVCIANSAAVVRRVVQELVRLQDSCKALDWFCI